MIPLSVHITKKTRGFFALVLLSVFSVMLFPQNWYINVPGSSQAIQIVEEEESQAHQLSVNTLKVMVSSFLADNILGQAALFLDLYLRQPFQKIPLLKTEVFTPPPRF